MFDINFGVCVCVFLLSVSFLIVSSGAVSQYDEWKDDFDTISIGFRYDFCSSSDEQSQEIV